MKSQILITIVASSLLASVFADGCTIDTTAEKDRCIKVACDSSEQCMSGYCMGIPGILFQCGGCNDNDLAPSFKCPGRFCNVYTDCAVPQCVLFKDGPQQGFNGTCGGEILEYKGLR